MGEKCIYLSACKDIKSCDKRHPWVCKRYSLENFCKFGDQGSYEHSIKDQNQKGFDDMFEDVKNLKAEMDLLNKN